MNKRQHFELRGRSDHVSREFIRGWIHATTCVLAYHGYLLDLHVLTVKVRRLPEGTFGLACQDDYTIELSQVCKREELATTIVHECIHLAIGDFGEGTDEKCTSTLTARLKPEIEPMATALIDGTYRRAAFIAHTKKKQGGGNMAYRNPEGEDDCYDTAEDVEVGVTDKYHKSSWNPFRQLFTKKPEVQP
mgnify:FL=1